MKANIFIFDCDNDFEREFSLKNMRYSEDEIQKRILSAMWDIDMDEIPDILEYGKHISFEATYTHISGENKVIKGIYSGYDNELRIYERYIVREFRF